MIILPAIDIKDGQCVRLYQGDFAQVTTYDADPVMVAQRWQEAGASWLHVVDLDGAVRGQPVNIELIRDIRETTSVQMEVGGGMRSLAHIEQVIGLGIERIILGTVALNDRGLLEEALRRWGERIAVGLDARDGWVATSGWHVTSRTRATVLATELCTIGVRRFIYTDIARDGALSGPNLEAVKEMQRTISQDRGIGQKNQLPTGGSPPFTSHKGGVPETWRSGFQVSPCSLIASGGVSSLADLRSLAGLGLEGAIVGKAIYTGAVDLAAAIQELEK